MNGKMWDNYNKKQSKIRNYNGNVLPLDEKTQEQETMFF